MYTLPMGHVCRSSARRENVNENDDDATVESLGKTTITTTREPRRQRRGRRRQKGRRRLNYGRNLYNKPKTTRRFSLFLSVFHVSAFPLSLYVLHSQFSLSKTEVERQNDETTKRQN